jgi:putative membrane protein
MDTTNNHLANERTFLAWIRTSFSIIIFGFVVARFGVALREFFLLQHHAVSGSDDSLGIGTGFMIVGIFFAVTALIRYQLTMRHIETASFKPANLIAILLGVFPTLFGIILVGYLIVIEHHL